MKLYEELKNIGKKLLIGGAFVSMLGCESNLPEGNSSTRIEDINFKNSYGNKIELKGSYDVHYGNLTRFFNTEESLSLDKKWNAFPYLEESSIPSQINFDYIALRIINARKNIDMNIIMKDINEEKDGEADHVSFYPSRGFIIDSDSTLINKFNKKEVFKPLYRKLKKRIR